MESTSEIPKGYKLQDGLCYGSRVPGLLEIKYHNPQKRNAIFETTHERFAQIINNCQNDEDVKVILVHGGLFYSGGVDISAFTNYQKTLSREELILVMTKANEYKLMLAMRALINSKKPLVALVRGAAVGVTFTQLALYDFIYCTPEARFIAPFMQSTMAPEGGSTYLFPKQFGLRKANEVSILDKIISADEAVKCGFAN